MDSKQIVSRYINGNGWTKGDLSLIIGTFAKDAHVVESDMSTYKGLYRIKKWIEKWNADGNVVNSWKIKSFLEDKEVFVFEWHFKCTVKDKGYEFDGISIGKIREGQIERLREYRVKI